MGEKMSTGEYLIELLKKQGREVLEDTLVCVPELVPDCTAGDCWKVGEQCFIFVRKMPGERESKEEIRPLGDRGEIEYKPKKELTQVALRRWWA